MIVLIIILIIIYLLSIRGTYKFIQKAHTYSSGKNDGRWSNSSPTIPDIFVLFIPVINSLVAIGYLLGNWRRHKHGYHMNLSKFFNIKNEQYD